MKYVFVFILVFENVGNCVSVRIRVLDIYRSFVKVFIYI